MIVTNTINIDGQRRVYLSSRGSLECWIEPRNDNDLWDFHLESSVTGNHLDSADKHQCAVHILFQLAQALNVSPYELRAVPFHKIAELHSVSPFEGRRAPSPKSHTLHSSYFATPPGGYAEKSHRTSRRPSRRAQSAKSTSQTF